MHNGNDAHANKNGGSLLKPLKEQWFFSWRILYLIGFIIALTVVSSPRKKSFPDLQAGERAEETVTMPIDITLVDIPETEREQDAARARVPQTYVLDLTVSDKMANAIQTRLNDWGAALERGESVALEVADQEALAILRSARQRERLRRQTLALGNRMLNLGVFASTSELRTFSNVHYLEWVKRTSAGDAISEQYVVQPQAALARENLADTVFARFTDDNSRSSELSKLLLRQFLPVNLSFDEATTQKHEQEAVSRVEEQLIRYYEEDELFRKGEEIDYRQAQVLRELLALEAKINVVTLFGLFGFFCIAIGIFLMFLYHFFSEYYRDEAGLFLLGLLYALPLIILKGLQIFTTLSSNIIYLMPIATATALVCLLFHPRLAIFFNVFAAGTAALLGDLAFVPFIVHWVAGTVVVFTMSRIRRRTSILKAGAIVAMTMVVVLLIGKMVEGIPGSNRIMMEALVYSLINGLFIMPISVIGLLVFFEDIFHRPTAFKLLELSDLSNDIFKEMLLKAGGTYQHSLTVGNLAEKAADEIGANSLLARVGAYYHDIGKLGKPDYFAENQNYMDQNQHSKIKPSLSASVLKSHVKQGVETAREIGLPRNIERIISQHHGTSVMQFFYHQALEQAGEEPVNREDYQYPGPKPQTREAAIVMLADSVEAAARTMNNPTPVHIEELVKKVVNGKFMTGELADCALTLNDLKKIVESFTRLLTSMYHSRIEYPDEQKIKDRENEQENRRQKKTARPRNNNGT